MFGNFSSKSGMLSLSLLSLLLAALFSASPACTKKPTNLLYIGEIGAMTDQDAAIGKSTHNGIELAVREINAAGGIKGKKLELVSKDDKGNSQEAASAATKLITKDKVIAILGETDNSRAMAIAAIAEQNHTPFITAATPNSTATMQGEQSKYIFRTSPSDGLQGYLMAKFALNDLKIKTAAILSNVKSEDSTKMSNIFIETFKQGGGQIVEDQSYNEIKAKSPGAIFVPGTFTEAATIAKAVREAGIKATLIGTDSWYSPKLLELGGAAIEGSYFSAHYAAENKDPHLHKFIRDFKTAFGSTPDGFAAKGYDSMMVLSDAMVRANTLSPSDIREAMTHTMGYPGVTGNITIDAKNSTTKSSVVLKVTATGFGYHGIIEP